MNRSCYTKTHPLNQMELILRVQTISFPVAQSRFYIRVNCVLRYGWEQVPPDDFILIRACCSKDTSPHTTRRPPVLVGGATLQSFLIKHGGWEKSLPTDWVVRLVLLERSASEQLLVWCFFHCQWHLLLLQGCIQAQNRQCGDFFFGLERFFMYGIMSKAAQSHVIKGCTLLRKRRYIRWNG